jgi:hypothetical protein
MRPTTVNPNLWPRTIDFFNNEEGALAGVEFLRHCVVLLGERDEELNANKTAEQLLRECLDVMEGHTNETTFYHGE